MPNLNTTAQEAADRTATQPPQVHWSELTMFEFTILTTLARLEHTPAPVAGLTIKTDLQQLYHTDINHGRLYPALDTLTSTDLITKEPYDGRTNHYTLTPQGRQLLEDRVRRLTTALTTEVTDE